MCGDPQRKERGRGRAGAKERERTRREVGQNPVRRRRETSSGERNRESLD